MFSNNLEYNSRAFLRTAIFCSCYRLVRPISGPVSAISTCQVCLCPLSLPLQALLQCINKTCFSSINKTCFSSINKTCFSIDVSTDVYINWASNGSAVHAYCDMTRSCGGVTGVTGASSLRSQGQVPYKITGVLHAPKVTRSVIPKVTVVGPLKSQDEMQRSWGYLKSQEYGLNHNVSAG